MILEATVTSRVRCRFLKCPECVIVRLRDNARLFACTYLFELLCEAKSLRTVSQEDHLIGACFDAPFESCGEAWEVDIFV
jgi:hypothetical protein